MTKHVILAYGAANEHKRAIFAILSFWAWYKGNKNKVETLVFTDRPEAFTPYLSDLPVVYKQLTTEILEEMYGPYRYIHRAKVAVVEQVFKEYPNDSLLFCDSDTFFVADPASLLQRLRPGVSLMHLKEYRYTRAIPKWATPEYAKQIQTGVDLIESQTYKVGNKEHQFTKTQYMYNSGVLGLTPEVATLIPDIYHLTDTLHGNHKWIISEQVAFSLALPTKTKLLCSGQYVFHYWHKALKVSMDQLLNRFLTEEFIHRSAEAKLHLVKYHTKKWPGAIVFNMAKQDVMQDFTEGKVINAIKVSLRFTRDVFASPYKAEFAKNLLFAFKERPKILN